MTFELILSASGLFTASVAIYLNYTAIRQRANVQRQEYLYKITSELFARWELREMFYKIDYEKFDFAPEKIDDFTKRDMDSRSGVQPDPGHHGSSGQYAHIGTTVNQFQGDSPDS